MMVSDVTAIQSENSPGPVRIPQPEDSRSSSRAERDRVIQQQLQNNDRVQREVLQVAEYQAQSPGSVKVDLSVDNDSGQGIFRIVDSDTNEVIREIPTEESRRIRQKLQEIMGLIFDREA